MYTSKRGRVGLINQVSEYIQTVLYKKNRFTDVGNAVTNLNIIPNVASSKKATKYVMLEM